MASRSRLYKDTCCDIKTGNCNINLPSKSFQYRADSKLSKQQTWSLAMKILSVMVVKPFVAIVLVFSCWFRGPSLFSGRIRWELQATGCRGVPGRLCAGNNNSSKRTQVP